MVRIISSKRQAEAVSSAVQELRTGACVAIPTETVYGLAADATNGLAVAKIFEMKNRPSFNPLICHVDGLEMAKAYGEFNASAEMLCEAFWPGPLTLVVPISEHSNAHDLVSAGLSSIGLRCPQGFSRQIIEAFGKPLAAPSANRSGRISPTSAAHVASEFENTNLMVVDDGDCKVGLESTILKVDSDVLTLLRPGGISSFQIEEVTGLPVQMVDIDAGIQAPGMMTSHYAPNAKVLLNCVTSAQEDAWLGFGPSDQPDSKAALNLSPSGDLIEAASNLYAFMKRLDASAPKSICVAPIPETAIGIAINDRLRRAAAPKV